MANPAVWLQSPASPVSSKAPPESSCLATLDSGTWLSAPLRQNASVHMHRLGSMRAGKKQRATLRTRDASRWSRAPRKTGAPSTAPPALRRQVRRARSLKEKRESQSRKGKLSLGRAAVVADLSHASRSADAFLKTGWKTLEDYGTMATGMALPMISNISSASAGK